MLELLRDVVLSTIEFIYSHLASLLVHHGNKGTSLFVFQFDALNLVNVCCHCEQVTLLDTTRHRLSFDFSVEKNLPLWCVLMKKDKSRILQNR